MAGVKGKSGNPKGRPAGVPNKLTAEIKEVIKKNVDDLAPLLSEKFAELDAKDWVASYLKLLEFVMPKAGVGMEPLGDQMKQLFEAAAKVMQENA